MLLIIVRAINTIFAVVAAIVVSGRYGDTDAGKLLTVGITSGVAALFELAMAWLPKRSATVRQWLDPRASFSGIWIQDVVQVFSQDGRKANWPNRFAVFSVSYDKSTDSYAVDGTAYTPDADTHSRWQSTDVVFFSKSGRSMTYSWEGIAVDGQVQGDPSRSGFAKLRLNSDDGGKGRVEHLSVDIKIEFDFIRVTPAWLARHSLTRFRLRDLYTPDVRERFATAISAGFGRQSA